MAAAAGRRCADQSDTTPRSPRARPGGGNVLSPRRTTPSRSPSWARRRGRWGRRGRSVALVVVKTTDRGSAPRHRHALATAGRPHGRLPTTHLRHERPGAFSDFRGLAVQADSRENINTVLIAAGFAGLAGSRRVHLALIDSARRPPRPHRGVAQISQTARPTGPGRQRVARNDATRSASPAPRCSGLSASAARSTSGSSEQHGGRHRRGGDVTRRAT